MEKKISIYLEKQKFYCSLSTSTSLCYSTEGHQNVTRMHITVGISSFNIAKKS